MARSCLWRKIRSGPGITESIPMGDLKKDDLKKPILPGEGNSDYERYLRTDELLALQKSDDELLHKDEMTFQVIHQSSEILMKGVAFELGRARTLIEGGDFANACRLIRRANS